MLQNRKTRKVRVYPQILISATTVIIAVTIYTCTFVLEGNKNFTEIQSDNLYMHLGKY